MTRESQRKKIKYLLLKGYNIDRYQAEKVMDCSRLAARIEELRKEGLPIVTEMVGNWPNKYGKYYIKRENLIQS